MADDGGLDVLLLGIDAGCLPVLDRLVEDGRVPALASLLSDGASAPLESQIQPWTPSAWPSLYTGVNPGKHGVYGFVDFDGYDWEVVTADHVREHSLWSLLDDHGIGSVVCNVPVTAPPEPIDGAVVPGFIGPEDPPCHPAGVLEDVREAIGEYRVYPAYARGDDSLSDDEKLAEYERLVEMRGAAFRYLCDRFDPEFGFLQFQKTDTVFHEFEGDRDAVDRVYEATDAQIGTILDELDPDTVFLASDHGIGPYEGRQVRVNEHLREAGYVTATNGGKGMPSWNPIRQGLREGDERTDWEPGTVERLAASAARFGLTASRVGAALRALGLEDLAKRYAPEGVARTANEQVDFAASVAYVRARTELGVRLNVAGREPDGIVDPEDYERVREAVIKSLSALSTPAGEPVFDVVAPRERYFNGPYVEDAVDVVTVPADFQHFLSAQLGGEHFGEPTEPWNHKLDGVFAATGAAVDADAPLEHPHLFDVAPTIMAALGVPYSDRMDGSALPIVADPGSQTYPVYDAAADGESTEAAVEARLSDLGYLE